MGKVVKSTIDTVSTQDGQLEVIITINLNIGVDSDGKVDPPLSVVPKIKKIIEEDTNDKTEYLIPELGTDGEIIEFGDNV